MIDKKYNIYAKEKCIYQSLPEEEFNRTWKMIQNFLSIMDGNVKKEDLTYEELPIDIWYIVLYDIEVIILTYD